MIEVYPERATLDIPDRDDQVVFGENPAPPQNWPFHVLLSVPLEPEQVERIGAREGWRAKTFGRGMKGHKPFFHVIEFWLAMTGHGWRVQKPTIRKTADVSMPSIPRARVLPSDLLRMGAQVNVPSLTPLTAKSLQSLDQSRVGNHNFQATGTHGLAQEWRVA
jgi:hypothetical protein